MTQTLIPKSQQEGHMSATTVSTRARATRIAPTVDRLWSDPAYQSFTLLRVGFAVLPIVMGVDKFFNVLVNWEKYLLRRLASKFDPPRISFLHRN
jgi:hypothetical protein